MTDDIVKRLQYDAKKLADDICGEGMCRSKRNKNNKPSVDLSR